MRTEHQLRDALQLLVESTPDADDVLHRLHLPVPAPPGRGPRWRPVLIAATVGLTLAVIGAIVLPYLTRRPTPEPADRRVPGNWAMISRIEPPAGWSVGVRQISGTYETTGISDPSGKGGCGVEVDGRGVDPQTPISAPAESVTVQGQPGLYQALPDRPAVVFWPYSPNAWASISCGLGPVEAGTFRTAAEIRALTLQLAETVTFGAYPVRVPIRLGPLPSGYQVHSLQLGGTRSGTDWILTLSPAQAGPTTPTVEISSAAGATIPKANTRVAGYPASFFTDVIHGPVRRVPRPEVSSTSLCVPSAPVPTCLGASNTRADDPNSRREVFHALAEQITYADSPTDTATWFDAADAFAS